MWLWVSIARKGHGSAVRGQDRVLGHVGQRTKAYSLLVGQRRHDCFAYSTKDTHWSFLSMVKVWHLIARTLPPVELMLMKLMLMLMKIF